MSDADRAVTQPEPGVVIVRFEGSDIVERLVARRGGVEQSWRFPARPAAAGDLVVEVDAAGAELVRTDGAGLLLRSRDGSLNRYGHATWIDANGTRTSLRSSMESDRIVVRVPAAVIERSSFPAVLDPMIGPEMPVDDAVLTPTPGQSDVRIFFDGTGYLITYRNASGTRSGVRMAMDGSPAGAPFALPEFSAVACNGTVCLGSANDRTSGMTVQRFQTDGTVLDATPVAVDPVAYEPSIAPYPGGFLVVWSGAPSFLGDPDLILRHFRLDGTPVESANVTLTLPTAQQLLGAGCGAANCLIYYYDDAGGTPSSRALRVAHDGTLLDPSGIAVHTRGYPGGVVHDGTDYLVHSQDRAVRISEAGAVLTAVPLTLTSGGGSGTCNASRCFLGDLLYARYGVLDHSATSGTHVVLGATATQPPEIACSPTGCAAVWVHDTNVMEIRLFDPSGVLTTVGFSVVGAGSPQAVASVASNGVHYLATWSESRGGRMQPFAARMDPVVGSLDPVAIELASGTASAYAARDVAFGRGTYIVSMDGTTSSGGVAVTRVSSDGSAPDSSSPVVLGGYQTSSSAIAHNGTSFLVVFRDSSRRVVGRRVNAVAATLESAPFVINGLGSAPDVASDGTDYLVVWHEGRSGRGEEIYGARVGADGTVLDASAIPIGSDIGQQHFARAAFDGAGYFVAWVDERHTGEPAIYGTRVARTGEVLDLTGIPIFRGAAGSGWIAAASLGLTWDGSAFVVTWLQNELREYPPGSGTTQTVGDVLAVRVGSDGVLLDPAPLILHRDVLDTSSSTAIASRAPGESLVAYESFSAALGVDRVVGRLLTWAAPGVACAAPADCDSGHCVDGICCNEACTGACEVCSIAAGGSADGNCEPAGAGQVCRASTGAACDVAEVCDGSSPDCPPDEPSSSCEPDAGVPLADAGDPSRDAGSGERTDAGVSAPDAASRGDGGSGGAPRGGCAAAPGTHDGSVVLGAATLALLLRRFRGSRRRIR